MGCSRLATYRGNRHRQHEGRRPVVVIAVVDVVRVELEPAIVDVQVRRVVEVAVRVRSLVASVHQDHCNFLHSQIVTEFHLGASIEGTSARQKQGVSTNLHARLWLKTLLIFLSMRTLARCSLMRTS